MSLIDKDRDVTTIPSNGCFYSLFDECDLLLSAPDLPATDLTIMCYACMFRACTHLKSGPDVLPASIVGYRCYYGMFMGCTELTSAPTLPATEFYGEDCYALMFMNCKNLTKAPELPAKYTYDGCYRQMFYGCSKLSYIKCLAVDINESTYYNVQYWLDGVSSTGTFVKSKSATSWPVGINGIPSGWTVVDEQFIS